MTEEASNESTRVRFHYLKCHDFRSIHVDGAIGGASPTGEMLHIALYSERAAIPQQTEQQILTDGSLGEPKVLASRGGIVREVQADAIMSWVTAKRLHAWLGERLKEKASKGKNGDGSKNG